MYTISFLVRFFPFWGLPVALVFFEMGMFFYFRRERYGVLACFGMTGFFIVLSIAWLVLGGYWRGGMWVKDFFEGA